MLPFALVLVALGALGTAILTGFVVRPAWLSTKYLVLGVTVFVAIGIVGAWMQAASTNQPQAIQASDGPTRPAGVKDEVIAFVDQSPGYALLFSVRADGSSRQRLADLPGSEMPALVSPSEMVVSYYPDGTDRALLQLRSMSGDVLRNLTDPPPSFVDSDPTFAANSGQIYFIRSERQQVGESTSIYDGTRLMRMPLGGAEKDVMPAGIDGIGTEMAVDGTGNIVAYTCHSSNAGATALCVADLRTGERRTVTDGSATAGEPTVSKDGTKVAFTSPEPNPYGTIEIWVADAPEFIPSLRTTSQGRAYAPTWSEDGSCLLFSHAITLDDQADIEVLCGTDQQPAKVTSNAYVASWFPKG